MSDYGAKQPARWQWMLATGLGWLLSLLFETSAFFLVGLVLMGIGQWLLLRQHVPRVGWWPLITPVALIVGGVAGGILGGILQDTLDGVWSLTIAIRPPSAPGRTQLAYFAAMGVVWGCMGASLAAGQWMILRRTADHGILWLSVHVVGLGFGGVLSAITPKTLYATIASSVVMGAASSFAVARCLPRSGHD